MNDTRLILIAEPSGSGKSTLADRLASFLKQARHKSIALPMDNSYRDLQDLTMKERELQNFDQPNAWEHERVIDLKR